MVATCTDVPRRCMVYRSLAAAQALLALDRAITINSTRIGREQLFCLDLRSSRRSSGDYRGGNLDPSKFRSLASVLGGAYLSSDQFLSSGSQVLAGRRALVLLVSAGAFGELRGFPLGIVAKSGNAKARSIESQPSALTDGKSSASSFVTDYWRISRSSKDKRWRKPQGSTHSAVRVHD